MAVAQTAPSRSPVATTQFDYYVMTLSWAPGFCDLGGKETSSPECAEGSGDGFVVHGLWPNNEYRPNPEVVPGPGRHAQPILTTSMASTPTIASRPTNTASTELARASARMTISPPCAACGRGSKIPEMFQATSEPLHMAPEEIEQAFMTANPNLHPDNMAISCSNGELVDVRFCLAKDLSSYAVCRKVARHTCQRASIVVAPVR